MQREDVQDVRQSLQGDGEAYARLVRRYQNAIAGRCRSFSRDPHAIEELTQAVFVEAYFSLRSYRGSAPLLHWLNRIATRLGYRYWKERARARARARHTLPLEGQTLAAAAPGQMDTDQELLQRALEALPPRDRLVLTLLYLEERTVAEAAELTGWTQTMVKVQAFRARGKLRKLLEAGDRAAASNRRSHL